MSGKKVWVERENTFGPLKNGNSLLEYTVENQKRQVQESVCVEGPGGDYPTREKAANRRLGTEICIGRKAIVEIVHHLSGINFA